MKIKNIGKAVLVLAIGILCLWGAGESTSANVIYLPEDAFAKDHEVERYGNGRLYEVVGDNISFSECPNGKAVDYKIEDSSDDSEKDVVIFYVYKDENNNDWGCLKEGVWSEMKNFRLIYDNIEFFKDNKDNITEYKNELEGYALKLPLILYKYPGSKGYNNHLTKDVYGNSVLSEWLTPKNIYIDSDGKKWGYVQSYRECKIEGWYCIDNLKKSLLIDECPGDVDLNGKVDLLDVVLLLKGALNIEKLGEKESVNADVDNNGKIDLTDTRIVLLDALSICNIDKSINEKGIGFSAEQTVRDSLLIQYTIFNNSDSECAFGYDFSLEKNEDGQWKRIEFKDNCGFNDIAIVLKDGNEYTQLINFDYYFDNLEEGQYRIKKKIGEKDYYAEFSFYKD